VPVTLERVPLEPVTSANASKVVAPTVRRQRWQGCCKIDFESGGCECPCTRATGHYVDVVDDAYVAALGHLRCSARHRELFLRCVCREPQLSAPRCAVAMAAAPAVVDGRALSRVRHVQEGADTDELAPLVGGTEVRAPLRSTHLSNTLRFLCCAAAVAAAVVRPLPSLFCLLVVDSCGTEERCVCVLHAEGDVDN
jgi:hypothetical protein